MSRSFIARKSLLRDGCVDGGPGSRAHIRGEVAAHRDVIGKRKRIKRHVREERRANTVACVERALEHQLGLEAIPVIVRDTGPYIHYPASVDDLQAVAALLPPDALHGVSAIELRLHPTATPGDQPPDLPPVVPDPYTGRPGRLVLGGAWASPTFAIYRSDTARIYLHAYVFDPAWRDAPAVMAVLRFAMLSSFVHELAHHDDRRRRVARGRWTMEAGEQSEAYAQATAERWISEYVLPYILERYSGEMPPLIDWITTWDGRPELREALDACPLLGDLGRVVKGWGASRRHQDETMEPGEHTTA